MFWDTVIGLFVLIFVLVKYTGYGADIAVNIITAKPWYFLIAFLGIYVCMTLAKYTEKIPYFNKCIAFVGKHSFSVIELCLISIELCDRIYGLVTGEKDPSVFGRWITAYSNKMWWVYIIAGTVLPVVFSGIVNKLKFRIERRIKNGDA